ncbi:putative reverse transcriptase domain-containing protein [Tanacetum coccineum]
MLKVLGERPEEKVRHSKSTKVKEQKLKDIVVVRNFSEVFPDDLSGLPPSREIEFRIDLIPGAMPVVKSPHRLAPTKMEELSNDTLIYSKTKEEHEMHLGLVLDLLKKGKMYTKFSKCELWLRVVQFLGHVINDDGIHVDPSKIETIKNWEALRHHLSKTFDWGEEQEVAFQTLKVKLCNDPILALSGGLEYFMVYCDASCLGLGCMLMQRGKIKLFSDYDCEIRYHPGKANVVTDALSRKEMIKPKRFRAMNMTIQSSIKDKILAAQNEASEAVNTPAEMVQGLDDQMKQRSDGALYNLNRIWVPLMGEVRTLIMDEAYKLKYSVHSGADKMYVDLKDMYRWLGVKKDIALYVSKCLTYLKIKVQHQRPSGLLQQPEIPEWKLERIAIDFITKLPRTGNGHDAIWVIMDRLTKSALFLPSREDFKMDRAYVMDFRGSLDIHLPLVEFSYNNSYHSSMICAPFESLYGRKCHSPILWVEVGERQLIGPEIVQETTEKISQIKDRLKTACDRQKSVVRFRKKVKLAPRFVGPFEITKRIGPVAYKLGLTDELNGVHDTFHVSNLNKFLADPTLHVPLEEIQVNAKLNFVEGHVESLMREFKKLKRSKISIVKIMVSTMTTCNAGRRTAATRGRGTCEQDGQEGERSGNQARGGRGGQVSGRGSQGGGQGSQESD